MLTSCDQNYIGKAACNTTIQWNEHENMKINSKAEPAKHLKENRTPKFT